MSNRRILGGLAAVALVISMSQTVTSFATFGSTWAPGDITMTLQLAGGAGSQDGAYASMKEEAPKMNVDGLEVRFVDLGNVGHTYAAENTDALRAAIAWAGGEG